MNLEINLLKIPLQSDKEQFANMLDTSYLPSEVLSILLKSKLLTKADKEKIISGLVIGRDLKLDNDSDIDWLADKLDACYCSSEFFYDLLSNKETGVKVFNCLISECKF